MLLIVGLGNPGKEYEQTRHNIGFKLLDALDSEWKKSSEVNHNHEEGHTHAYEIDRQENKTVHAVEYELDLEDEEYEYHIHVGLMKPATFMNRSGEVVKQVVSSLSGRGFEVAKHLLVVHDEMDLSLGETKLSFGRGSARHNGVQNIIDQLGTQEFHRLRIGIGRSLETESKDHVLSKFTPHEKEELDALTHQSIDKISDWILQAVRAGATDTHET